MIKSLEVRNLNGNITGTYEFNQDLNILTGKNGSGKTTVLKLMWALMSANSNIIFNEMTFEYLKLEFTNSASIEVIENDTTERKIQFKIKDPFGVTQQKYEMDSFQAESIKIYSREEIDSIFFPTFRRIEGGFGLEKQGNTELKQTLEKISNNLSYFHVSSQNKIIQHQFITALSTDDIKNLLTEKYSEIADDLRILEEKQSKNILKLVDNNGNSDKDSLDRIRVLIKKNELEKEKILRPFSVLSETINQIFKSKSIHVSNSLSLGEAKDAITSDKLSAGEKQMLSFLCYNFFYENTVIFIDEPELSLHTDWQRILFPLLLKQESNNQFIVATHSPFIYSKYPDKEIMIDEDKGNKDA